MKDDDRTMELTDILLGLKRGFEDKNIATIRELFRPNPKINADGKFYSLAQLLEALRALFDAVEQTYFDVVATRRVEAQDEVVFGTFEVDIAWIAKSDWLEHMQRVLLSLEVSRDPKTPRLAINGLTSVTQPLGQRQDKLDDSGFPADVGGAATNVDRGGCDPFSIWY
jgi:hypothetical protein